MVANVSVTRHLVDRREPIAQHNRQQGQPDRLSAREDDL